MCFVLICRRKVWLKLKRDQCHNYIAVQTLDPWTWVISRPHMNRFERLKHKQLVFHIWSKFWDYDFMECFFGVVYRYVRVCRRIHRTWMSFSSGTSFMEKEARGRRHRSAISCKEKQREVVRLVHIRYRRNLSFDPLVLCTEREREKKTLELSKMFFFWPPQFFAFSK